MLAVHGGRVDRGLEVALAVSGEAQEELRRPLVLLIAARRAEREPAPVGELRERRRERGARALARRERVRVLGIERRHLQPRAEREAELGDHGRGHDPAAARRRRHGVAPASTATHCVVSVRPGRREAASAPGSAGSTASVLGHERPARRQPPEPRPQLERRLLGVDERAALRGVVAREQRVERDVREARVAIARVAVGERELRASRSTDGAHRGSPGRARARSKPSSRRSCCRNTGP